LLCWRCRARLASAKRRAIHTLPLPPPLSAAALLTNRRLLTIRGPDAIRFLQGLVTNNVRINQSSGFYAAFLNAQGRVLNDVFIYPTTPSKMYSERLPHSTDSKESNYLIEVDADEAEKLLKYLKMFKLRSKITLALIDPSEWNVWTLWRDQEPWTPHAGLPSEKSTQDTTDPLGCLDTRAPGMGRRIVLPASIRPKEIEDEGIPEASLGSYTVRRMLKGVAEGQKEILRETALPQESNGDYMGGIDFKKGCYVGQELTIRTHHTGVVRKRILPVQLYKAGEDAIGQAKHAVFDPSQEDLASQLDTGSNIKPATKRGRSTGKWLAGIGNIGLALCRLETMTDLVLMGEGSWTKDDEFRVESTHDERVDGDVHIKAFVPSWQRVGGQVNKEDA
jgi:folate-binding protein YgfZ